MPAPRSAKAKPKPKDDAVIVVDPIKKATIRVAVLGSSPLILNRLAEKGLHDLLFPPRPMNAAERAANLKHDPRAEFRASVEKMRKTDPTHLGILATAFKGAMMSAALRLPGATKTEIGSLTWVEGAKVAIHGIPKLFMAVVRNADAGRTPDVRTRALVERWACEVQISYVVPLLTERTIVNLLSAGGIVAGVGDWRQEKGKGSYGQFDLVSPDNAEWREIMAIGRAEQAAAMDAAEPYDEASAELLGWFDEELVRRGRVVTPAPSVLIEGLTEVEAEAEDTNGTLAGVR